MSSFLSIKSVTVADEWWNSKAKNDKGSPAIDGILNDGCVFNTKDAILAITKNTEQLEIICKRKKKKKTNVVVKCFYFVTVIIDLFIRTNNQRIKECCAVECETNSRIFRWPRLIKQWPYSWFELLPFGQIIGIVIILPSKTFRYLFLRRWIFVQVQAFNYGQSFLSVP